jgi:hypothetical protein
MMRTPLLVVFVSRSLTQMKQLQMIIILLGIMWYIQILVVNVAVPRPYRRIRWGFNNIIGDEMKTLEKVMSYTVVLTLAVLVVMPI